MGMNDGTAARGKRVIAAMSGGVDSSVAAYLLHQQGYDVIGVTMRLWSADEDDVSPDHQGCCSIQDIEDARRVCQTLGVPHYVVDARHEFREHVIAYFVSEYERGRTPHPCIACNDRIKFDFLMQRAAMMDADYVATGHYARIERDDSNSVWTLRQGVDAIKDQSYVLFGLGQEQLHRVLLPVGGYTKDEIRSLAREAGFHLADKVDSQEICFIPDGDYRRFMRKESAPEPGELVDAWGRVVGEHPGIEFYTVGQRRGIGVAPSALGLPEAEKVFVTAVDPETRRITVGGSGDLLLRGVRVGNVRYVAGTRPADALRIMAKIRYNGRAAPALLHHGSDDAVLWFDEPQRAVTPGQAAVFYDDDRVLGGGFIEGPAAAWLPSIAENNGPAGAPAAV